MRWIFFSYGSVGMEIWPLEIKIVGLSIEWICVFDYSLNNNLCTYLDVDPCLSHGQSSLGLDLSKLTSEFLRVNFRDSQFRFYKPGFGVGIS